LGEALLGSAPTFAAVALEVHELLATLKQGSGGGS
jgi:hypothetical protein